jgi:hypothetical protein
MVALSKQTIGLKIVPAPSGSDPILYWFSAVIVILGVVMLAV